MADKPSMQVISGRPLKVQENLRDIKGVYVQCRLPSGEDAYVPLAEIYGLLERELKRNLDIRFLPFNERGE